MWLCICFRALRRGAGGGHGDSIMHVFYSATLHRSFVLRGSCTLRLFGDSEPKVVALGARDSAVVPAGMEHVIESCSDDFEMLEVRRLAFSSVAGCRLCLFWWVLADSRYLVVVWLVLCFRR